MLSRLFTDIENSTQVVSLFTCICKRIKLSSLHKGKGELAGKSKFNLENSLAVAKSRGVFDAWQSDSVKKKSHFQRAVDSRRDVPEGKKKSL